jgi:hypothetical protein
MLAFRDNGSVLSHLNLSETRARARLSPLSEEMNIIDNIKQIYFPAPSIAMVPIDQPQSGFIV